ncbi:hypothetical protein N665_0095s0012 [Sinapis alba]|nr:hypothetical protein N665_0095s0012 [Sinapis alba]
MTSVCVKNVGTSPEKLSPASHSRKSSKTSVMSQESQPLENEDPVDFEFLLEDPVTMLTADELFSDGKLVPLKFSGAKFSESFCSLLRRGGSSSSNSSSNRRRFCSSKSVKELGGSKSTAAAAVPPPPPSPPPLLIKDSDISESSTSISSSRLSLSSSSSSGHELDDVPRLSLDLDKPNAPNPFARSRAHQHLRNQQRKPRRHSPVNETTESSNETRALTVTADSPRLNASGKIVFHGLERSSSSPGNFTGGPRLKQQHHGMPRSQSAHVRITPVLNVPVSSLRGGPKSGLFFGQLFTSSSANRAQLQSSNTAKNRTNRTRLEPTSEL